MAISHWPAAERPRERLLALGARVLSDAELIALLLGTGVKGKSAVELARDLLAGFGGLAGLLVETAHDAQTGEELAARARRYIAGDTPGTLQLDALDPSLVRSALIAAIRADEAVFFDALLATLLASSDTAFRESAAFALGSAEDAELALRVRALLLDNRFNSRLVWLLASSQSRLSGQQEELLKWLETHFDALASRLDANAVSGLPGLASLQCSPHGAARAKTLFTPKADVFFTRRELAQAIEGIELCAARKQAQAAALEGFFSAR